MDFINITNTTAATTTVAPSVTIPAYWGYLSLVLAVVFFGSNFLPVKQYETGDGMFFQLVLCLAIWTVGFVINWFRNFPQFYALPMLGGVLWATGNINTVPIIKCIGIGLGMLFWGTVSLIIGWANARFGWFGVKPEVPSHQVLNYLGVSFAAISAIFYLFIKSDTAIPVVDDTQETSPLIDDDAPSAINETTPRVTSLTTQQASIFDRLNPNVKRILGTCLACFSGVMYGLTFTPELYVVDNYEHSSQNGLDYVFSLYTGILLTSVVYFTIYCIFKKNRPDVNPQAILPGMISGWMWGIANAAFFVANTALSQAISFPIVASGPPVIASLYGIFLYREVRGKKNIMILCCGFAFAIAGSVLCGLSK